jgi:four helix bundle protein
MYQYHKLKVYTLAKDINVEMLKFISQSKVEFYIKNQLGRATLSIMLNIAEGSGRNTNSDQSRFYVISRSSLFEVSSILELLIESELISIEYFRLLDKKLQTLSRQLLALINSLRS